MHLIKSKKWLWLGISIVILTVSMVVSRAQATIPNPLVYEVKDSNGSIYQIRLASIAGHGRTYAYNVQWGKGIKAQQSPDMIGRILSDVAYYKPTAVLIEMGVVDTELPEVYNGYSSVIDQIMAHISVPVVWLQVPLQNIAPPYTLEGANAINSALISAEDRYSSLWAIPTQQIWEATYNGQCPVVTPGSVVMMNLGQCFLDLGNNVHYNSAGYLAIGIIEDAAIEQAMGASIRDNQVLMSNIAAQLAVVATDWEVPV
jgi:hypothetical protein